MNRPWICMFFAVAALAIGFGGCASMLVSFNSAWHGAPSAGQMVGAVAFDAVTIPVQLPFWIALGVGSGLDKLDRGIEDRSWQSRRRELHDKFLKDPEKMQDAAPEFHSKGLPLGLVYADEAIPLSEKFLVSQVMQYFAYVRPMGPIGGGMWDLCAVGTPVEPCSLLIGDVRANIVELYGDKKIGGWDGKSKYIGGISAVVLEFESVAMRDRFLGAVIPACHMCEPECWSQLVIAPMDGSGECYGICLERESKPEGSPSRIFIINLECPAPIRFWPPRQYGSEHVWFADGTNN